MPKPILAQEQFDDILFPIRGVDVSQAFAMQQKLTTPVGENVRAFEPETERGRGGARPGLSRYLPSQVDGAAHLIQELAVVVDPQADAFGISFLDIPFPPFDDIPDFSDLGRAILGDGSTGAIRNHGSGFHTNKAYKRKTPLLDITITANNITKLQGDEYIFVGNEYSQVGLQAGDEILLLTLTSAGAASGAAIGTYPIIPSGALIRGRGYNVTYVNGTMTVQAGIQFVQGNANGYAPADLSPRLLAFTNPVAFGNLLLVCVGTSSNGGVPTAVVDSLGNTYANACPVGLAVSIWYCISGFSGANTVSVSYPGGEYTGIAVLEYSGVNAIPLDAIVPFMLTGLGTTPMVTDTVPVNNVNSLVVGAFAQQFTNETASASGGNNLRCQFTNGLTKGAIYVVDQLPVSAGTVITATLSPGSGGTVWDSFGASFKKA